MRSSIFRCSMRLHHWDLIYAKQIAHSQIGCRILYENNSHNAKWQNYALG